MAAFARTSGVEPQIRRERVDVAHFGRLSGGANLPGLGKTKKKREDKLDGHVAAGHNPSLERLLPALGAVGR